MENPLVGFPSEPFRHIVERLEKWAMPCLAALGGGATTTTTDRVHCAPVVRLRGQNPKAGSRGHLPVVPGEYFRVAEAETFESVWKLQREERGFYWATRSVDGRLVQPTLWRGVLLDILDHLSNPSKVTT